MTIDTWKDMESELLWSFYDDMFACRIPTNHMVVFGTLEEAFGGKLEEDEGGKSRHTRIALSKRWPVV